MRVDANVRREAVLRCFTELHIRPGGGVFLKTLQQQWGDKGLRGADLLDGVEEMAKDGLLTVVHDAEESDLFVTLLPTVQDATKGKWLAPIEAAHAGSVLRKARKRDRDGPKPDKERRHGDDDQSQARS